MMKVRKMAALMLSMVLALSLCGVARAEVTEAEGQILIPFTKVWEGDGVLPEALTVTLYRCCGDAIRPVAEKTLTAEENWQCVFDVSDAELFREAPYTAETAWLFRVAEDAPEGWVEIEHTDPGTVFAPPEMVGAWVRYTPCNELSISAEAGKSIVAAKKGHECVVWTPDALAPAERQAVVTSLLTGVPGIGNPGFRFFSGFGTLREFGITVGEDTVSFEKHSDWSLMAVGAYEKGSADDLAASITNHADESGPLSGGRHDGILDPGDPAEPDTGREEEVPGPGTDVTPAPGEGDPALDKNDPVPGGEEAPSLGDTAPADKDIPKTGDSGLRLWIAALAVSALGLIALAAGKKRIF